MWLTTYAKTTFTVWSSLERDNRKAATNETTFSGVKMPGMYSRVRNLIPVSELAVTDATMGRHSTLGTDLVAGT